MPKTSQKKSSEIHRRRLCRQPIRSLSALLSHPFSPNKHPPHHLLPSLPTNLYHHNSFFFRYLIYFLTITHTIFAFCCLPADCLFTSEFPSAPTDLVTNPIEPGSRPQDPATLASYTVRGSACVSALESKQPAVPSAVHKANFRLRIPYLSVAPPPSCRTTRAASRSRCHH